MSLSSCCNETCLLKDVIEGCDQVRNLVGVGVLELGYF